MAYCTVVPHSVDVAIILVRFEFVLKQLDSGVMSTCALCVDANTTPLGLLTGGCHSKLTASARLNEILPAVNRTNVVIVGCTFRC